jgi:hypothetical protein
MVRIREVKLRAPIPCLWCDENITLSSPVLLRWKCLDRSERDHPVIVFGYFHTPLCSEAMLDSLQSRPKRSKRSSRAS